MSIVDYLVPGSGMLDSFLHPERGYDAAGKAMQSGYDASKGYYDESKGFYKDAQGNLQPFRQQGLDQYGRLNDQANALNNPGQLENQWASGYEMSPYAQHAVDQATATGRNEASSMGLNGSSAALNNVQTNAGNIMQSDRQQYMNDLMQKYMASIGIGQNLYGTGAAAGSQMGTNAMNEAGLAMQQGGNAINNGVNMGQAAFGKQNAPGEMFGKMLGTAANAGINYTTGGVSGAMKNAVGNGINQGMR